MFEDDIDSIQFFIQEHYTTSLMWGDFRDWLRWYYRNKLLGYIKIDDKIEAVALVRFVKSAEQAIEEPYYTDPEEQTIWVELVIARDPANLAKLIDLLLRVWGARDRFAARRNHLNGVLKTYPFGVLLKLGFTGLTKLLNSSKQMLTN